MMKDDKLYITHILDSIEKIEEYTKDVTKEDFETSTKTQDAVIRQLEIIGEATRKVSSRFKDGHSHIPWSEMSGMRDKLIHGYFGVDIEIVWETIQKDIPDLKEKMSQLQENE